MALGRLTATSRAGALYTLVYAIVLGKLGGVAVVFEPHAGPAGPTAALAHDVLTLILLGALSVAACVVGLARAGRASQPDPTVGVGHSRIRVIAVAAAHGLVAAACAAAAWQLLPQSLALRSVLALLAGSASLALGPLATPGIRDAPASGAAAPAQGARSTRAA